jgi:hypothetical protein
MKKLNIIYFCWINVKKNYKNIICGQLNDIISCGILNISKLYIEVCNEDASLRDNINIFINEILQNYEYEISFHEKNNYEYYGIKKLYDIAVLEPTKYFVYLHSKGMFNYDNVNERHIYETSLTKGTFLNYNKTIQLFDNNPNIMKAAVFPSNIHMQNFCWLNFYWARGTYLITCDNPIITDDRYYYERWSESGNNLMGDVYNLLEDNYKKYILGEVADILNKWDGKFEKK